LNSENKFSSGLTNFVILLMKINFDVSSNYVEIFIFLFAVPKSS